MGITQSLVGAWTVLAAATTAFTAREMSGQPQHPPLLFTGIPRDIDFVKRSGWTQVVLHAGPGPTDELISQATNDGIVRMMLLALTLRREATVEYADSPVGPPRLISATVALNPAGQGQVQTLSFDEDENYCRAMIDIDNKRQVEVWTKSYQIEAILETAARDSIPIGVDFDADTMEITRAKVNIELPPDR